MEIEFNQNLVLSQRLNPAVQGLADRLLKDDRWTQGVDHGVGTAIVVAQEAAGITSVGHIRQEGADGRPRLGSTPAIGNVPRQRQPFPLALAVVKTLTANRILVQ